MADVEYELKNLDLSQCPNKYPTILAVGKRFAGKSTASVIAANSFPHIHRWAAWCGTKDTEDYWADKFESHATVYGPDELGFEMLQTHLAYQETKVALFKHLKLPFPDKYSLGMIFDDMTSKRNFRKGEILEYLFSNGRHLHAAIIIAAQYLKQLPPAVRLNADYIFILHNAKKTLRFLHEEFLPEPEDFNVFLQLFQFVTGETTPEGEDMHNALVFDNVAKTKRLDVMYKVFRSHGIDTRTIKLGAPEWREYNKTHWKDPEEEERNKMLRRARREERLRLYRERQHHRQQLYGTSLALEPDPEDTDSEEDQASVMLTGRKMSPIKLSMERLAAAAAAATPPPPPLTTSLLPSYLSTLGPAAHPYADPSVATWYPAYPAYPAAPAATAAYTAQPYFPAY